MPDDLPLPPTPWTPATHGWWLCESKDAGLDRRVSIPLNDKQVVQASIVGQAIFVFGDQVLLVRDHTLDPSRAISWITDTEEDDDANEPETHHIEVDDE